LDDDTFVGVADDGEEGGDTPDKAGGGQRHQFVSTKGKQARKTHIKADKVFATGNLCSNSANGRTATM
jgi:hypothetical protein